jgi:hypothetical protein
MLQLRLTPRPLDLVRPRARESRAGRLPASASCRIEDQDLPHLLSDWMTKKAGFLTLEKARVRFDCASFN